MNTDDPFRVLRVAFVGITRPPSSLPDGYWEDFVRYHLELPYYYGCHPLIKVHLVTSEQVSNEKMFPVRFISDDEFTNEEYDVVIHWRSWHDRYHRSDERNIMLSQDHSFNQGWLSAVRTASRDGKLDGILVFPGWHKINTHVEIGPDLPLHRLYDGLSFGVDTNVYYPSPLKDPRMMLWASDPGRGLDLLIDPFIKMWSQNKTLRLTIVHPDYVTSSSLSRFSSFFRHPGVIYRGNVKNGEDLWNLFRTATFFPYSSSFPEPSSRCHRQAQACGAIVLYPELMGTPSETIVDGVTGIVRDVSSWPDVIESLSTSDMELISRNARAFALSETWDIQAQRFYEFFSQDFFYQGNNEHKLRLI